MELKDYTTEQLQEEIQRRRNNNRIRADNWGRKCHECKYFGKIDHWGRTDIAHLLYSNCCEWYKDEDGLYENHSAYDHACEHFEIDNTKITEQWTK